MRMIQENESVVRNEALNQFHFGCEPINYQILSMISERSISRFAEVVDHIELTKGSVSKRLNDLVHYGYIKWEKGNGIEGPGTIEITEMGEFFLNMMDGYLDTILTGLNAIAVTKSNL